LQYYKPWATTPEDEDRIQDQIAEAQDIIRRELNEYEALYERERPDRDAGRSGSGKESNADIPQQPSTTNRGTNDSAILPKDPESREDHADDLTKEAVSGERAVEIAQDSRVASHEHPTSKDLLDDNGEEVLEAAEDTVIY